MEYLRKVVRTNKEPDEKEVLWVDTAHPDYPVMKYYENGNWKLIRQREDGVAYIMPYGGIPYSDLSQEVKTAIASGGAQANWNQTNSTFPDFIWNKPYIPTTLADLTEDSNHKFVSAAEKTSWSNKAETSDIPDVSGKADRVQSAVAGHIATLDSFGNLVDSGKGISDINSLWGNIQGSLENQTDLMSALGDKLELFVTYYDETPFEDILAAYNSGKLVVCIVNGTVCQIGGVDESSITFYAYEDYPAYYILTATIYTGGGWDINARYVSNFDGAYNSLSGKPDLSNFITKSVDDLTYYYTKTEIDSKVSSAYKAAGTVASVASLGTLDAAHEGFVYNMSASFTTTSDFVEGVGKTYPVGTNVVIVDVGAAQSPSYKYDVLAGFVDLSGYAQTADVNTALAGKQNYSTGTSFPTNPQEGDVFVLTSDAWIDVDDNDVPYTQEMGGDMFYLGGCVDEMHGNFDGEGTITGYDMDGTIFFEDDYDGNYTKLDIEGCEYVCIKPGYSGDGLSFYYVPGAYVYQRGMWMPIKTMETNYFYWNLLVDSAQRASTAYQKPSGGIPKTDLADAVQTSLGKADTALQSFTETDPTVPSWAKASSKPSYDYSEISNTPTLPADNVFVATYGTTTASEIAAAITAGKAILATDGTLTYQLGKIDSNYYRFSGIYNNKPLSIRVAIADDTWATANQGELEQVVFKRTSWQTTPSDDYYPSEKLVKDSLDTKADKVSSATSGHLAGLDSNGNLTDSGKSTSDFQPTIDSSNKLPYSLISGTPTIPDAVEANPTVPSGTTPTSLTGLKIGASYYGIEGAVSDVTVGGTSVVSNGVAAIPAIPDDAVAYSSQSLTTAQQMQARANQGLYCSVSYPSATVSWDGSTTGRSYKTLSSGNTYYKISDVAPNNYEQLELKWSDWEWSVTGSTASDTYQTDTYIVFLGIVVIAFNDSTYVRVDSKDFNIHGYATFDKGIYALKNGSDYVQWVWYNSFSEVSNKISTDYLPISKNISYDSNSTTKVTTPSAVYGEIHPEIQYSQPSNGFLPNIVYDLGTITGTVTFSLDSPMNGLIANAYFWTFETGSTAPQITWPVNTTWAGGSAPTISASKHYEIMIRNGYGTFIEF